MTVGFFPWCFVDGESCIGRAVAIVEEDRYEELMAKKASAIPTSASIPDELPQSKTHSTHSATDGSPVMMPSATVIKRSSASPFAAHSIRLALSVVVF